MIRGGRRHGGDGLRMVVAFALFVALLPAQQIPPPPAPDAGAASSPAPAEPSPSPAVASPGGEPNTEERRRTELNLLGQTNTAGGESRRNENVQFNLIDNNALKELNIRLGVSATIVSEFLPDRSYFGAEFGTPPPAPLFRWVSRREGVHGKLSYTHLNSIFSARSFFQVGAVKPARENRYGAALSFPLWRGGGFSLDAGQEKIRGNVNGNVLVPRPDERTPLAVEPRIRAIVQRFLDAFPKELPNRTDINERALNTNSLQRIDNNRLTARLDQQVGSRDKLLVGYSLVTQKVLAFQLVAGQNPDTYTRSQQPRIHWVRTVSAATIFEGALGFDRLQSRLMPEKNAVGYFVLTAGALEPLGPGGTIPIDRAQNHYRGSWQLRRSSTAHTFRAGFELLRRQLNGIESDVHRGFFSFNNDFGRDAITNLRLGTATQFLGSRGNVSRGYRNWDLFYFAGDVWKPRSWLTLNFGLLYQPVTRPVEVNNFEIIPYRCDCNNLSPRGGFAIRLPAAWGALRGAYGLHYGQIFPVTFQQVRFSPPHNIKAAIPTPDLENPWAQYNPNNPNAKPTLYRLHPNLVTPYTHQYNFSWEREAGALGTFQAGYVGSRSHKLLFMDYTNRAHPVAGIPQTSATINIRRANPSFADIREVINGSIGYYDALRVTLTARQFRGLSFQADYWFSKALDLASSYTNTAYDNDSRTSRTQSEFDRFRDMKGRSDFDQPHAFLLRSSFALPRLTTSGRLARRLFADWNLGGILLLKTGTPFSVIAGSDAPGWGNVDGNGGDRPNLLDPSVLGRTIGHPDTAGELLPRSAFRPIGPWDAMGNLGRNVFRKGGIRNLNAVLSRSWTLHGESRLAFRMESVNFLNTPQFAEPGKELANPNFGFITNTLNDGRTFQFGLDWVF